MVSLLPANCQEKCPFLNHPNSSDYPLGFTLNCKGPQPSYGEVKDKVQLHRDGTAEVVESNPLTVIDADGTTRTLFFGVSDLQGELVCRNRGAALSIETMLEATGNNR